MKLRTFTIIGLISAFVLAGVIGVAGARTGGSDRVSGPPAVTVSALSKPFHPSRRQRRELRRLRRHIGRAPAASIASTATVSDARPVLLPEGLGDAWVSTGAEGAVCTFIPDPMGGYGASCASQTDLRAGGAVTVLGGAGPLNDEAIAVMVVPDGGQDPVVTDPSGSQESRSVDGIGATIVPESARVTIGAVSLEVPAFDPLCTSNPNEDFRRCGL